MNGEMEATHRLAYICLSTILWTVAHQLISDKLALLLLPQPVCDFVNAKKKEDKNFRALSTANGTALLHAVIVSPLCLVVGIQLMAVDPWEAESDFFEFIAIIMLGYFCWDVCICVTNIGGYGISFLLHGAISLVGLYVQVSSSRCRMLGFTAMFAASEISTPFLHCRWFCLRAHHTHSRYFTTVNGLFILSFFLFRVTYLPFFVFYRFWKDCYELRYVHNMSDSRRRLQVATSILWTALNVYWAGLLIYTQLRARSSLKHKTIHTHAKSLDLSQQEEALSELSRSPEDDSCGDGGKGRGGLGGEVGVEAGTAVAASGFAVAGGEGIVKRGGVGTEARIGMDKRMTGGGEEEVAGGVGSVLEEDGESGEEEDDKEAVDYADPIEWSRKLSREIM
eukprot:GHVQ01015006.1.p1 GENE.GHVQ01015006.1~~GHVQ01015006.1.p1  ORF type:complete len:394 (+),score=61.70 GHVQ01015006.1:65-1246(+)